jgi:hypothetical protein
MNFLLNCALTNKNNCLHCWLCRGNGCARVGYPGVYARVASSEAIRWIKENACPLSRIDSCSLRLSNNISSPSSTDEDNSYDNQPIPSHSETSSSSSPSPSNTNDDVSNGPNHKPYQPTPSPSPTASPSSSPAPTPQPTSTTNFYDSLVDYWQAAVNWLNNLW